MHLFFDHIAKDKNRNNNHGNNNDISNKSSGHNRYSFLNHQITDLIKESEKK